MTATIVDWARLLNVIWAALAAGVGVTIVFALTVLGAVRVTERRARGRPATVAFGSLAVVGVVVCAAVVAYSVVLLSQK